MNVELLKLKGTRLITGNLQPDLRGGFFKIFNVDLFRDNGIDFDIVEIFYSFSKKNVIRGMHFQFPPFEQAKLIHVIRGKIDDIILDLRTDSNSYGEFMSIELAADDGKILYVPRGCAHGFISKDVESIVIYAVDAPYSPLHEGGILYSSFGYDWGDESKILSKRDASFVGFDEFSSPFLLDRGGQE